MRLGLDRHRVRVVDHQSAWLELGRLACARLQEAAGDLLADVQHVGSTAVSDLPAKPVLDLAAALEDPTTIDELVARLTGAGFLDRGDCGADGGHLFVEESAPEVRTIHLHVVRYGGRQWRNYLAFRDRLSADGKMREQYAELKRRLGARHAEDRAAYTSAKREFIEGILSGP